MLSDTCPGTFILVQRQPYQCIGRVPDVTAPTARYPYEATLHQGEIESIFLDSMKKEGLQVERPIVPIALQISDDPRELADPHSYPVKVGTSRLNLSCIIAKKRNSSP